MYYHMQMIIESIVIISMKTIQYFQEQVTLNLKVIREKVVKLEPEII